MERYTEVCGDNRFELIKKYKERLVAATNIETAIDEMNVIDSILFRFWQMGWLDRLEADVVPKNEVEHYIKIMFEAELIKAKQEVAREVIDEFKSLVINYVKDRDLLLVAFKNAVAHAEKELKKKYIGDTQ